MRRLFTFADRYYRQRDWKMLIPLKLCLLAAGCLLGLTVKKERKRPVAVAALVMFVSTYIPLMVDVLTSLPALWPRCEKATEEAEEDAEAAAPETDEEAADAEEAVEAAEEPAEADAEAEPAEEAAPEEEAAEEEPFTTAN